MQPIVSVQNLTKKFNEFTAVDQLSFSVNKGSVYGFLGQNGAGKSTTIRMLMTLIKPTTGSIQLFNQPQSIQSLKKIGAVIERPDLYKYLSAFENVQLFAKLSNYKATKKEIEDVLQLVGLEKSRFHSKMKTFSQGMKQRLGIATALIHQPELIILDEPVNGLDPQGIADMRHLILKLKNELGKTLIVSSHLLSEMQMIATDLLIIHKGKKVVEGTVEELLNPNMVQLEIVTANPQPSIVQLISALPFETKLLVEDNNKIVIRTEKRNTAEIHKLIANATNDLISFKPQHSLEDYFLEQIQNTA
jgi:ABC-type multidrug transport system ATPase subunit